MQDGLLPLFPLNVVLLPGAPLPLHIFEERYKEMIGEAIRENSEFGIVLATDKGILNIGCTAVVKEVVRKYPDGRMDILTVGLRRFEIVLLNEEKPYLRGAVQFFDDENETPAPEAMRAAAIEAYNQLRRTEGEEEVKAEDLDAAHLSFRLAQAVPDHEFRQMMLRMRSESDRMRQLVEFLPFFAARQQRISHIKRVARTNGSGQVTPGL